MTKDYFDYQQKGEYIIHNLKKESEKLYKVATKNINNIINIIEIVKKYYKKLKTKKKR